MNILTVDCGTTNSRAYVVTESGVIRGKGTRPVGVRDTATSGSRATLETGIDAACADALRDAHLTMSDISFAISSGMITSELGLVELPHLEAPVRAEDLAANLTRVDPLKPFPDTLPVYFVRGIKNRADWSSVTRAQVGLLDFMRGEEAQVCGMLSQKIAVAPVTVVILSSHTKFISIDHSGAIRGSITTLSGQIYSAILAETSIGKSIEGPAGAVLPPLDTKIVREAYDWTHEAGLLRSLLMTRFMDVLISTEWHERKLFVEAAIAAADLQAMSQFSRMGLEKNTAFVLVGDPHRCALYEYLLTEVMGVTLPISVVSDIREIDSLSIHGVLDLAARAEIL